MALDIILLLVFLIFVVVGVRRGFIRSAAGLLSGIIAIALSAAFGGMASQWLFDTFFRDSLIERITESMEASGGADVAMNVFASLPDFVVRVLEDAGVTAASVGAGVSAQSAQVAQEIAGALEPVFVSFLKVLCVIALFFLFLVVLNMLMRVIATAFELPVLSQINGLLGGVFGVLEGILAVWILVAALQIFIPMLSADMRFQVESAMRDSAVLSFFTNLNPLGGIFRV